MGKLWEGRFKKQLDGGVSDFNSSISVDSRMFNEDIAGSVAHVTMLGKTGIISEADAKIIAKTLSEIHADITSGKLSIDQSAEDIHSFLENELTDRIGETGKKLHTARSRNDQVALDFRMYVRKQIDEVGGGLMKLVEIIDALASENLGAIMPGYTHLQRAQPITFAHHLMAYNAMFMRDLERLSQTFKRTNVFPLGSGALAGTTYPIDRKFAADMLGFDEICFNSLDGVSDRDFAVEFSSDLSIIMMHLSRLCEEIVLWSSWEFKFIELDDAFSTGSSIMPQKKNPDIAELIRGKTGRVYGGLQALLTMMKGLPLAYNKDMQEDKEILFDGADTVLACLNALSPMLATVKVNKDSMKRACRDGFINATDCADYLTKKGVPFRDAYKITGSIVAYCIDNKLTLETLTLEQYKTFSEQYEKDIFDAVNIENCVEKRNSFGGPNKASVKKQIQICKDFLTEIKEGKK